MTDRVPTLPVFGFPTDDSADARALRDTVAEHLGARWRAKHLGSDREALLESLADAPALITLLTLRIDGALLERAPALRVVGNVAVGVDNIDLEACRARGIAVVNTPDVLTRATAELAVALLFAAARRVGEGERMVRDEAWGGWALDQLLGLELEGRHAVLLGRGRIGEETGRRLEALGLTVEYITRAHDDEHIRAALGRAQVLSLHAPLTEQTRGWLSRERLATLPADAIVLNTARGPLVDEDALAEALAARRIFAAGLDVYAREPAVPEALRALNNVVLLPHLGSATRSARLAMARLATTGVRELLEGGAPDNRVV
jgi:lactate dehydrogenase-like 2-hydroxyacid dehydrogenase